MKFRPTGKRVLVKEDEAQSKTDSGIYIPDTAKEPSLRGVVVAVGNKCEEDLIPGDIVSYGKYSGSTVKVDDIEYLLLQEDDVFGVFE